MQSAREARLTTKNSTVDNLQLPSKSYTGKQWEFMAPASMIIVNPQTGRDETVTAYLRLGIKPNCMNLQPIGITYDRGENWYDITNGTAGIPLRVPLSYSWKKKGEKPDQPKRTKKPDRPDRPDRPR